MAQTGSSVSSERSSKSSTKSGNGKVKPSYKHIPHSQKPAHLVAKRNARERRRVQAVNQAFYKLRKCVPIENRNKRVSKVKTLQRAIDYIRKLEQTLAEDDEAAAAEIVAASLKTAGNQFCAAAVGAVPTVSQVATGGPTNQQQQQQLANCHRRAKKSTICDQLQLTNTITTTTIIAGNNNTSLNLDSNQSQSIMRQRRGRRPATNSTIVADPSAQLLANDVIVKQPARDPLTSSICNQTIPTRAYASNGNQVCHQPDGEKQIEPYYCPPQAYQPQAQQQHMQSSTELQSSAYSLDYYNEHYQQYPCPYLATSIHDNNSANSGQVTYNINTDYTSNNFYNPTPSQTNYASYALTSVEPTNSSSVSLSCLAPATQDELNCWQQHQRISSSSDSPASVKIETLNLNDSVGSSTTNTTMLSTPLNSSTSSSSSNTGPADSSTRATSLALLRSPNSSTSPASSSSSSASNSAASSASPLSSSSSSSSASRSSASTSSSSVVIAANSDNSSTVVCRSRNSTASLSSNKQQVNSYLAYASNRMEARAAHLPFASMNANSNTTTNTTTTTTTTITTNNNNDNAYHHRQQQQQFNERKSTTNSHLDEVRLSADGSLAHRQVRHLLNGTGIANATSAHLSAVSLSVNNLHDQHQPQYHHNHHHHHHLHQQSSFPNNQHSNSNHLSALQSMAASNNATSSSSNTLLMHQQTIQGYTSLPL